MAKPNERTTIKNGIVFVKPAKGHSSSNDNKQTCLCTESVAHSRTEITAISCVSISVSHDSHRYVVAFCTRSNSPSDRSPLNRVLHHINVQYLCVFGCCVSFSFRSLPLFLAVSSFLLILTVVNFAVMLFSSLRFACVFFCFYIACCCNSIS